MDYIAPLFDTLSQADGFSGNIGKIDSFHWEKPGYSRPESFFTLCAVKNTGLIARLWSFEAETRAECTKRDEPVYTDSCLEFFVMPLTGDRRYMNFEVNPNGVYLSEVGEKRGGRQLIKDITSLEPEITPFTLEKDGKTAWGYKIFLSDEFVSAVFGKPYRTAERTVKGNFYKCADLSVSPHYGAHFPVESSELGFHNPERFGNIIIKRI